MPRLHLFEGYGVELEYMIVDRDSLAVKPIADELLKDRLGMYGSDFENGIVTWSNELVLHVIELKSTKPERDFNVLEVEFIKNITQINAILSTWNCALLPTAAHPFMDPNVEARLWPHDNNEVYEVYNRIFDCRGHGWSNLQSTHLNFPFFDESEFAKLHAAIRLVLPILPALCASSPIVDKKFTGVSDTRLNYYRENQKRIPSIVGKVIPEQVFTEAAYAREIYAKIRADIAPFDAERILDPVWVNSRGAISRFDRGSIEIRLMDVQECPAADLAIAALVIETIKALVTGKFIDYASQAKWESDPLASILFHGIEKAEAAVITNKLYLGIFGMQQSSVMAGELWEHIYKTLVGMGNTTLSQKNQLFTTLFTKGSLATRMLSSLEGDYSRENMNRLYQKLRQCLEKNVMLE